MPAHNTVYKLWLGLSSLGKSCGLPKASFYMERFVPKHATAHIHKRSIRLKFTFKFSQKVFALFFVNVISFQYTTLQSFNCFCPLVQAFTKIKPNKAYQISQPDKKRLYCFFYPSYKNLIPFNHAHNFNHVFGCSYHFFNSYLVIKFYTK